VSWRLGVRKVRAAGKQSIGEHIEQVYSRNTLQKKNRHQQYCTTDVEDQANDNTHLDTNKTTEKKIGIHHKISITPKLQETI
jgi:hypothetical protein